MKLKAITFACCLSWFGPVVADNHHHYHPANATAPKKTMIPGYCEIEIINFLEETIHVTGVFQDDTLLRPFEINNIFYPNGTSDYISLEYKDALGFRCHSKMHLQISTSRVSLLNRDVYQGKVIEISYGANQAKVSVRNK
jgi:hypothetical protein